MIRNGVRAQRVGDVVAFDNKPAVEAAKLAGDNHPEAQHCVVPLALVRAVADRFRDCPIGIDHE